jgi:hypothetical protein
MVASPLLFCFVPLLKNLAFQTTENHGPSSPCRSLTSVATALSLAATPSSDTTLLPIIREAVAEAGGEDAWKESTQILSGMFELEEDAEWCLATAFQWQAWAKAADMVKRYQNPVVPDATKVQEALAWLQEGPLALTEEQMKTYIREYPQIYLVAPMESYRKVVGVAPRKYRDKAVLKELIQDNPNILQLTYNCDGEGCASECGSCWVSYENRLPSTPSF